MAMRIEQRLNGRPTLIVIDEALVVQLLRRDAQRFELRSALLCAIHLFDADVQRVSEASR